MNCLAVPCLLHTRDQSQIFICGNPPEPRIDAKGKLIPFRVQITKDEPA